MESTLYMAGKILTERLPKPGADGSSVETPSIYLDLTAEENLREQYLVLGMPSFEGIQELLKLVGLQDAGKKKAKDFSLGYAAETSSRNRFAWES